MRLVAWLILYMIGVIPMSFAMAVTLKSIPTNAAALFVFILAPGVLGLTLKWIVDRLVRVPEEER